jgi:integrase
MGSKELPRGIELYQGKLRYRKVINGVRHSKKTDLTPTESNIKFARSDFKKWVEEIRYPTLDTGTDNGKIHTFREAAELFLINKKKTLALSTLESYQIELNFWQHDLYHLDLRDITASMLITLDEKKEWKNERTRHNKLTPLKGVFKYAISRGWIDADPSTALQDGKYQVTEPDPYTQEELDRLFVELDKTPFGNFYRIAFGTGMRTGELLALTWEKFNGETLYINDSIVNGRQTFSTKTKKPREIILGLDEIAVLKSMPRPINGGFIFTYNNKMLCNGKAPMRYWKSAHIESSVRRREGLYPWRHTYISSMLSQGVDEKLVAEQSGDRLDTILKYYYKYIPRPDDKKIIQEALARIRGNQ